MKKILTSLFILLLMAPVFAMPTFETRYGKEEEMTERVGFKILNANKIPYRMIFLVDRRKIVNACTSITGREIVVFKGLFPYLENEDELAAVLAHEISHAVDSNQGILKGTFSGLTMSLNPKKYETKADKRAVDYLVNAGYNPVLYIIVGNKIFNQRRYDWFLTHPLGSRRLMTAYEYIYTKYPEYLVNNKYKDNPYYQNFLITSKENRKKFEQKIQSNSNRQLNYQ